MISFKVPYTSDGNIFWLSPSGLSHREDGPACEYANGDKYWLIEGKHHREDGPAIEFASGSKQWYINNKLHRLDGPAIIHHDGTFYWYVNDEQIFPSSNEEFLRLVKLKAFW